MTGEHPLPTTAYPPLPKLWVGYLLALVTFVGQGIAVSRHPELLKQTQLTIAPLEMFLPAFVASVYWLVCVYRYHVILARVPGWKHPISPAKAVGFHLIPLFYLVWIFIWPREVAKFVNGRLESDVMRGWFIGVGTIGAVACEIFFDPAVGIALLFLTLRYLAVCLSRALAVDAAEHASQS